METEILYPLFGAEISFFDLKMCAVVSQIRLYHFIFSISYMYSVILKIVFRISSEFNYNCQRAAEAKRPRLRGGSIIEPRVYLDVQGEKISSDPEKR